MPFPGDVKVRSNQGRVPSFLTSLSIFSETCHKAEVFLFSKYTQSKVLLLLPKPVSPLSVVF
jgi:hypothetical protein